MKRSFSFYESPIELNQKQRDEIHSRLGGSAAVFIKKAALAGGEYEKLAEAWSGPSPADVRKSIKELGTMCAKAAAAIHSLPAAAPGLIRQAQALDASSPRSSEMAKSLTTTFKELQIHLRRIESACSRAASFNVLNPRRGKTRDDARRHFIAQLGDAYFDATGKAPARRSSGNFAQVASIVMAAAGADPKLSNDLLVSVLGPSSAKTS